MNLKVRDRTEEELEVRKNEFLKICKILDELNVRYFLSTGILLGAVRDNSLIKWDWDIEISVFAEEFIDQIDNVASLLRDSGFNINNVRKVRDDSKIDFFGSLPSEVTGYTIFSWNYSKIRDVYWRREFSIPSKFLNSFSSIEFLGRKFNCPNNPKEYLKHAYGNWETPIRTSDKNEYNSKEFKSKKLSFLRDAKNWLKKLVFSTFEFIKK